MKFVLTLAALGEAATGLALVVSPPIVIRLLFGAEIADAGVIASRVAGLALIALGIACWPGAAAARPLGPMLTYSSLVTIYFLCLGLTRHWTGKLLWPAVGLHAVLSMLLALTGCKSRKSQAARAPG
jgi:hypothetical protein